MLILGLDTTTPWGTIALVSEGETVFEISLNVGKGGGEYLLSSLDLLMKRTSRKISDIDLIAVGTGPGSYTGIRVGLATAKGLAEGLHIPVQGVSTLRVIAENAHYTSDWIASVIDARRGDVYAALYQRTPKGLSEIESPIAISANEFVAKLVDLNHIMFCGNGSKVYQSVWSQHPGCQIAPVDWDHPLGSQVARVASQDLKQNQSDPVELAPCYLRKVEAEVRWEEGLRGNQN